MRAPWGPHTSSSTHINGDFRLMNKMFVLLLVRGMGRRASIRPRGAKVNKVVQNGQRLPT